LPSEKVILHGLIFPPENVLYDVDVITDISCVPCTSVWQWCNQIFLPSTARCLLRMHIDCFSLHTFSFFRPSPVCCWANWWQCALSFFA